MEGQRIHTHTRSFIHSFVHIHKHTHAYTHTYTYPSSDAHTHFVARHRLHSCLVASAKKKPKLLFSLRCTPSLLPLASLLSPLSLLIVVSNYTAVLLTSKEVFIFGGAFLCCLFIISPIFFLCAVLSHMDELIPLYTFRSTTLLFHHNSFVILTSCVNLIYCIYTYFLSVCLFVSLSL
jgi:hypothetical protein